MNRRGILALFGGAVAMPAVGAKAAAQSMGIDLAVGNVLAGSTEGLCPPVDISGGWWGSAPNIAFEVKSAAREYERNRYDHMKSWGRGFRQSVIEREIMAERLFRSKCERDEAFVTKVFGALK